jgi:hypothetical protein
MPSFQRLLVLAVLGMSMYARAAPVAVSAGTDVEVCSPGSRLLLCGGLTISCMQVAAPVARDLATYNFDEESLDARDFDVRLFALN